MEKHVKSVVCMAKHILTTQAYVSVIVVTVALTAISFVPVAEEPPVLMACVSAVLTAGEDRCVRDLAALVRMKKIAQAMERVTVPPTFATVILDMLELVAKTSLVLVG